MTTALLLAGFTHSIHADPLSIYDLTLEQLLEVQVVSIATGTQTSVTKAPAVATVITAADIQQMSANTIYEVIGSVTGIHIYPSDINRLNSNFSIRGIHSSGNSQTLVLVNGLKTTMNFNGARWNLFNVGLDLIERIEVIRGPGSAIYGADAFSGVINIITKGHSNATLKAFGAKAGGFGVKSSWLNLADDSQAVKYKINAQWHKTSGDPGRIVEKDSLYGTPQAHISLAPRALDTRLQTIDLQLGLNYQDFSVDLWWLENQGGTGAGSALTLSDRDWDENQTLTARFGYQQAVNAKWTIDWQLSYQQFDEDIHFMVKPPGYRMPSRFNQQGLPIAFTTFTHGLIGEPILKETNYEFSSTHFYNSSDEHQWRFELGWRQSYQQPDQNKNFGPGVLDGSEEFVDDTVTSVLDTPYMFIFNQQRQVYYLTAQDQWRIHKDWTLTAGARYDHYSDFGSTFNPRLALVWQTQSHLTTKFLYGEAFRAPSFAELYAVNNPVIIGNPDLNPETIKTYEYTMDYRPTADWQLLAGGFYYQSKSLIAYVPQMDGTSVAQNIIDQQGYGLEFEGRWQPNKDWWVKLGYVWQRVKDADQGFIVADAPQRQWDVSINHRWNALWNLRFDSHWVGKRLRRIEDPREPIEDYIWSNLALNYQLSKDTNIKLSLRNLFDVDAREPAKIQIYNDFPLAGRAMWLSIDHQF